MNRRLWVVIAIIALVALGVYAFPKLQALMSGGNSKDADLEYLSVETGTLSSSVSATGSVEPHAEAVLSFESSGRIVELLVQENDPVTKGALLARLDTARMEESVLQARAALAGAEAQLAQVLAGTRSGEIATAEAAVTAAQAGVVAAEADVARAEAQLTQVLAGPSGADIAIAQSAVDSAQAQLDQLLAGPDPDSVAVAKLNWELAQNALWEAQLQYDDIKDRGIAQNFG